MRCLLLSCAVGAALISSPAYAEGEANGEVRASTVVNGHGVALLVGVGTGYDWILGKKMFVGMQATGEVSTQGDFGVIGGIARIGPRLGDRSKLYALGGAAILPGFDDDGSNKVRPVFGAGAEIGIGRKAYGKLEYRLYTGTNVQSGDEGNSGNLNQLALSIGVRF
jgi:hypothetical protein